MLNAKTTTTQRTYRIRYNHIGQIIVECSVYSIDSSKYRNLDLVFDTGATVSGIGEKIALDLGYDKYNDEDIVYLDTAGGDAKAYSIILSQIQFSGVKYRNIKMLRNIKFDKINIDGVIGLDIIMRYNILLDFSSDSMLLRENVYHGTTP